ncbi:MAG TPA: 16S rRNA (guanine(966)-N(2))-methyltransferase RsmD [Kiritimatiellia bacterium]|nr:16S rRNA (guanine(966)-N(2))-methyltransferase RsmD [Kiritimatiellia bacterium]HRZ12141.1 16S rRNA (guanine(966)-N(2))-methyltransferase RsmD [Kiritimatiellia bacterium]HSA18101.1 16S rRNA (guanine(966)-N(2))-methyltransferase RsmD [Kiritimatiellia bacterium]
MRITGGILKGRILKVPSGPLRPTQDKVRAALFSMLGEAVVGARVLDLFAGTGALGLEAWSRGAAHVCWVDSDPAVLRVLRANVDSLCAPGGGRAECRRDEVFRFLERPPAGGAFDLVLADPPYDREGTRRWLEKTLLALQTGPILAPEGLLAFEQSAGEPVPAPAGWSLLRDRKYGETRLLLYRRQAGESGEKNT